MSSFLHEARELTHLATAQVFMNEENIADVHAEVDGPGTFSLTASCSRFSNDTNNL